MLNVITFSKQIPFEQIVSIDTNIDHLQKRLFSFQKDKKIIEKLCFRSFRPSAWFFNDLFIFFN